MHSNFIRNIRGVAAFITVAWLLIACDRMPGANQGGQVIALVNGYEITVHQLNNELAQLNLPQGVDMDKVTREVLQRLVDRQLLIQQAEKTKLDRKPAVVMAIARSRDQVLAKTYLERVISTAREPTEAEITAYYHEHPEFFGERKIYSILQMIISLSDSPDSSATQDQIREHLSKVDAIEDMTDWLNRMNLPYRVTRIEQVANKLPAQILGAVIKMEPGQTAKFEADDGVAVLRLIATRPAKLSEDVAAPAIKHILTDRKNKALATAELESLRANATVEYFEKSGNVKTDVSD